MIIIQNVYNISAHAWSLLAIFSSGYHAVGLLLKQKLEWRSLTGSISPDGASFDLLPD